MLLQYGEESNYRGYFLNGLWHGPGVETFPDSKLKGEFKNGKRDGRFKITYPASNCVLYREYKDDKEHGY